MIERSNPDPKQLLDRIIDQYDLGLANLDAGLGDLFAQLAKRGLADNTLIVVTSDHGEFLGEHQLIEHSKDVYEEALRIPLVVHAPGQVEAGVDDTVVVSNDVPHLVLSLFPRGVRDRLVALSRDRTPRGRKRSQR